MREKFILKSNLVWIRWFSRGRNVRLAWRCFVEPILTPRSLSCKKTQQNIIYTDHRNYTANWFKRSYFHHKFWASEIWPMDNILMDGSIYLTLGIENQLFHLPSRFHVVIYAGRPVPTEETRVNDCDESIIQKGLCWKKNLSFILEDVCWAVEQLALLLGKTFLWSCVCVLRTYAVVCDCGLWLGSLFVCLLPECVSFPIYKNSCIYSPWIDEFLL